jgi:hypothetical protein
MYMNEPATITVLFAKAKMFIKKTGAVIAPVYLNLNLRN